MAELQFTLREGGGQEQAFRLGPGVWGLGGPEQAIPVAGCSGRAAELQLDDGQVAVRALRSGLKLRGLDLPPGEIRLLRPGDSLQLQRATLHWVPPSPSLPPDEAGLARALLKGHFAAPSALPVASLHWLSGLDRGCRLGLFDEAVYLGRGRGAGARVRDPLASKAHARIDLRGAPAWLEDLGSANGTRVNGRPVDAPVCLRGGEVICIGDTEIAFEAAAELAPSLPSASGPPAPSGAGRTGFVAQGSRPGAVELGLVWTAALAALGSLAAALWLVAG